MVRSVMLWLTHRQLKSKDAAARREAVAQLCEAPSARAVQPLRTALEDEDAEVRRLAALALGKLADDRGLEPLLAALRDRKAEVVVAVIGALKRFSDQRVVPALVPLLRHADAAVRGHAAQALEFLGWRPASREDEIWTLVARGLFSRVVSFGAVAVPALEAALVSTTSSLCVGAIEALGHIGDKRVLRPLLHALKSPDPGVCIAAVDALCRLGEAEAVEPLIGLLRHVNGQVRVAAVEALGRLRAPAAVKPICAVLKDRVWEVRREAAEALGRLHDPAAVEGLVARLGDEDADVREATAVALGTLGDRRAIGPLVLMLKDSTSGVRRIAAAALARIDTDWNSSSEARGVTEELKSALQHDDPGVRHFVGQLLANLGATGPEAATYHASEESAVSSPARRRKLAVSLFVTLLSDPDRDLRQAAAEALGCLGDSRAQPALLRAEGDPDVGVRAAAERALQGLPVAGAQA